MQSDYDYIYYEIVISVTGHIMTSLCHNAYALVQKIVYLLSFLLCLIYNCKPIQSRPFRKTPRVFKVIENY